MLISLKNDRLRDKERKKDIEGLLGTLADERFALLVNLGKKITDWSHDQSGDKLKNPDGEEIDENIGVKVMIGDEDDDEDDDNDVSEIVDEQDDEEEGQDAGEHQIIQGNVI